MASAAATSSKTPGAVPNPTPSSHPQRPTSSSSRLRTFLIFLGGFVLASPYLYYALLHRPSFDAVTATAPPVPIAAHNACRALSSKLGTLVSYPRDEAYRAEVSDYWNIGIREHRPACVVHPTTADETSVVVAVLREHDAVRFAVKSGGHDANYGHASVDGGVLVAMRNMAGVEYDAAKGVALVKTGGTWGDVVGELQRRHGVTIAGGRLDIVGIGGYLLQGGISFFMTQYGLAADNVIAWEMVFPNGTIGTVVADENPDLARAMRGGGSQFGIVTRFHVRAYPLRDRVWGGLRLYPSTEAKTAALYAGLHDFAGRAHLEDPRAAVIVSEMMFIKGMRAFQVYFFYDGETPPEDGPFADLLKVPYLTSSTKATGYAELLRENSAGTEAVSGRMMHRTFTIPYLPHVPSLHRRIADQFAHLSSAHRSSWTSYADILTATFQPFPRTVGAHSEARGGNAMGLRASDPDRMVVELTAMWRRRVDEPVVFDVARAMTEWVASELPGWEEEERMAVKEEGKESKREGEDDTGYMPMLMNDAMADQDVTGGYRDFALFRGLQREIDPDAMFRTRAGGFKF